MKDQLGREVNIGDFVACTEQRSSSNWFGIVQDFAGSFALVQAVSPTDATFDPNPKYRWSINKKSSVLVCDSFQTEYENIVKIARIALQV